MAGPKPANAFSLRRFIVPALFLGFVFAGYFRTKDVAPVKTLEGPTMGTFWTVKVVGGDVTAAGIQAVLDEIDAEMTTWDPSSAVSRFNDTEGPLRLSPRLGVVVEGSLELSRLTDGAFDITVGPLVGLWGFGADAEAERPSDEALAAVEFGWQGLSIQDGALRKENPALRIDLSAIAKGYGVDVVAEHLREKEATGFMIEVGGEVLAEGTKNGLPWKIGIERPDEEGQVAQQVIELEGALATSGDYRQFIEDDEGKRSHTIDPRTRRPVEHDLASVSVRAESCMEADGWATALTVLGPEAGLKLAEEQGLAVMMLRRVDGGFEETSTSNW